MYHDTGTHDYMKDDNMKNNIYMTNDKSSTRTMTNDIYMMNKTKQNILQNCKFFYSYVVVDFLSKVDVHVVVHYLS
jgi:hypothetical protein